MPPKTDRRHRQGHESRVRILEAALEIAAERGYDGTTVALVTERTGLPASSVYWHFKNKDALLAETLEYSYRIWREGTPTSDPLDVGEPSERVEHRFAQMRDGLSSAPEFWRLGLMLALLRGDEQIAARDRFLQVRQETLDATVAWWDDVLPDGTSDRHPDLSAVLTQLVMASGDGLFVAAQTERAWNFPRLTDSLARAFASVAPQLATAPRRRRSARVRDDVNAPQRREPEESRDRLLAAAAEVATERGYVGTTISRVCERSGLPVSSLYWFFDDKDALLAAVVQHSFDEWLDHQPTWTLATTADMRVTVLKRVLRRTTRSFGDAPDFLRIGHMVALERQDEDPAARVLFLRIRRDVEKTLTAWFAGSLSSGPAAGDRELPRTLARLVIAITDGLFLAEQMDSWDWDFDALVDALVAVLEEVVAQREAELGARTRSTSRARRSPART